MKNLLLILTLLFLCSCSKNKVFEKFEKFDDNEWPMSKTVKFDVAIEDTSAFYNVYIPVRHIDNYPYDGLLLNVSYDAPNGESRTKNYKLKFRDAGGKFIGDVAGDIWDEKSIIMEKFKFNSTGTYKFEIVNNMPTTPTVCIMEVGLTIEKSK
jgi:gliding motility-associated lipoprotein GldH